MTFWSVRVSPKAPTKVSVPKGHTLRLTQCSLGEKVKDGRTLLKVIKNGTHSVISSLVPGKMEHSVMEIVFEEGVVEFTVAGPNKMNLAGNMLDNNESYPKFDGFPEREFLGKSAQGGPTPGDEDDDVEDMWDGEGDEDEDGEEEEDAEGAEEDMWDGEEEEDADEEKAGEEEEEEEEKEEEEEEKEEEAHAGKKRPAAAAAKAAPPAKAAKTPPILTPQASGTPALTPSQSAHGKEISAKTKAKIKQVLAGHADGIKGASFHQEWHKTHGSDFKGVYKAAGFKKMTAFLKAAPDVVRVEQDSFGNFMTFPVNAKK